MGRFVFNSNHRVYSVNELTEKIGAVLDSEIGYVLVRGEVSNLRVSDAGHAYFTLKDERSQISAVLFRGQNIKINFKDGSRIVVGGAISVYAPRGVYQIIVDMVVMDGLGDLYLRFEELKKRLFEKGLFLEELKREIPEYVFHIGVITSPYGAAVRDFLRTVYNKNPFIKVVVYGARVQGEGSSEDIISGINYFNANSDVDVIAIIRGGGSFEDLFCFNDEALAYAIRKSRIPIVTGIGHEIDFTIADYVADYRAATPTAAAEYIVKDFREIAQVIRDYVERLTDAIKENTLKYEQIIKRFINVFYRDKEGFDLRIKDLDLKTNRLNIAIRNQLIIYSDRISEYRTSLERYSPYNIVRTYSERVERFNLRLGGAILNSLDMKREVLEHNITRLNLLNPENILKKGYSVVYKGKKAVRNSEEIEIGDSVEIRFYSGGAAAEIKSKR